MPVTTLNAMAQSSAERLVNSTVEGAILALLVWLVLRLLPRQNAGTRFSLWMAALLSIATLPLAEALARVDRPITSVVSHTALTMPAAWGTAIFLLWALIASLLLTRVLVGVWQLGRLRRSAEEIDLASLDPLSRQTLAEFQQYRKAALCVSGRVSVPTAVGLFRAAVVLPRWVLSELSAADLNSVLVHELAHLRRRDDWTNLLQKLVHAVFFFHPAIWWIESRLSLEREMACDEHVLTNTEDPRAYAECLVSLAEKGFLHRAALLAQGAVHRVRECSIRVTRILANGRPRTAHASRMALLSAASGSVLLLATFAQAPNLVSFRSQPTGSYAGNLFSPANGLSNGVALTPAAWHPDSQPAPVVVPANYVVKPAAAQVKSSGHTGASKTAATRIPAAPSGVTSTKSAPLLHKAGLTLPPQAETSAVVIVRETGLYSDGSQLWTVSIYHMTVLKPHVSAVKNDNPRKAI